MKRKLVVVGLVVCVLLIVAPSVSMAQPGRDGGRGFGGFGGGGQQSLQLLGIEAVANELDLVDDQKDELKKIGEGFREEMREVFQGSSDMSREERGDMFRNKMKEMQKEIDGILTPQQQSRLKQIRFQIQMRFSGTASNRSVQTLARELELSDDEKEELLSRAEEVRKNLQEKIAEVKKAAMDELLESLSSEQREKLENLTGDAFEIPRQQMFGGGRGDRGGRGGQGRGGQGRGGRRGGRNNPGGDN